MSRFDRARLAVSRASTSKLSLVRSSPERLSESTSPSRRSSTRAGPSFSDGTRSATTAWNDVPAWAETSLLTTNPPSDSASVEAFSAIWRGAAPRSCKVTSRATRRSVAAAGEVVLSEGATTAAGVVGREGASSRPLAQEARLEAMSRGMRSRAAERLRGMQDPMTNCITRATRVAYIPDVARVCKSQEQQALVVGDGVPGAACRPRLGDHSGFPSVAHEAWRHPTPVRPTRCCAWGMGWRCADRFGDALPFVL
jgi:hypothetical protein